MFCFDPEMPVCRGKGKKTADCSINSDTNIDKLHKMLYYPLVEYTKIGSLYKKTEIRFEITPKKCYHVYRYSQ